MWLITGKYINSIGCRITYRKTNYIGSLSNTYCVSSRIRPNIHCSTIQQLQQPKRKNQSRFASTFREGNTPLHALPFSVAPDQALESFYKWAKNDQGLKYILSQNSVRIGASYCPVWSFDVNLRFVTNDPKTKRKLYSWKPSLFAEAYPNTSVVFISGLSTYAGHSYRRSLLNPLVNTTLVFLGQDTVPFGSWMLRDMRLSNDETLSIFPDPWNATRSVAFRILKDELQAIASHESTDPVQVQTQIVSSRRVYLPTYVIDYKVLGVEYRAFVSGCDSSANVAGVSHQVWESGNMMSSVDTETSSQFFRHAWSTVQTGTRILGGRQMGIVLVGILQLIGSIAARFLVRIPIIGAIAGVFVGFRKILRPWIENRWASAEWERQREHEKYAGESHYDSLVDDFIDSTGAAKRFYDTNRPRILKALAGDQEPEKGEYDWYKNWEKWAREQWEHQQTYQQRGQQQQQQQQYSRQRSSASKTKTDYKWDFNVDDPYSVLGIKRGATKSEVSAAFRREMLKWHPDTQSSSSEAERERATERSKLITDAYRKIKTEMSR